MSVDTKLRTKILEEIARCAYCGFCEWVCPTLNICDVRRNYGPRGRVNAIFLALKDGLWTSETLKGIYSCLLCGTCSTQCPASIDIPKVVRMFRNYLTITTLKLKPLKVKTV